MKQLFFLIFLIGSLSVFSQESEPMLLGKINGSELRKAPYNQWFDKEYNNYIPDKNTVSELKNINWKGFSIQIFMGTWCSDTHRELPRLMKILDEINFPKDRIELIAVNTGDNVHKQSPTGEHIGKYIFRVGTFIVSKENKEINRIVEFPVVSLENDLLTIASGNDYSPNYRSYPLIIEWIENGTLTSKNITYRGLAERLRYLSRNASEINSAAFTLCEQGKTKEAAAFCRIALALYPDNANYYSCAYIFSKNGEYNDAMQMIKKYLAKSTNENAIESGLELYEKIKQRKTE